MIEVWVDVTGYENSYKVSSHGRVLSKGRIVADKRLGTRKIKERILVNTYDATGYQKVTLHQDAKLKVFKVHRLVAMHFCIRANGCDVVNHIDNVRDNNHAANLEWTTVAGNNQHMMDQGRHVAKHGVDNKAAKINDEIVQEIFALNGVLSQRKIGLKFGICQQQVSRILSGDRWSHVR